MSASNNQEENTVSSGQKKSSGSGPRIVKPVFYSPDGKLIERSSLSCVVSDAVKRWYNEAEREASRGDVKAMALLGQMLMEGYGCDVDMERGKQLAEKARRRGYRMHRVYCEI
jgi:TPR repeat protein